MTTLASDDFVDLGTVDLVGRTLNNALGGSGTHTWGGSNFVGNGSGGVISSNSAAKALVDVTGSNKARVRINPNSGTSNLILWGRLNASGSETGIGLLLAGGQTSLRVASFSAGARTDHQTLGITAPGTTFWMEVEVNGLVVTCRVLNNDTSVRNTVSHTFSGSVPSGGNNWGFGFYLDGATGIFDDLIVDDGASGDTTAPTLTSATASATSATTSSGSVTTDEAGPAWAVLTTSSTTPSTAQIKAGQDHAGASAAASDTATLAVGANTGAFGFTGHSAGTTYYMHVVQDDEASPANTSTPISSASFTTPSPDTTAPTFTGSITVGAKTSSTIALTLPTATDNVAVTGYEYRVDSGAWVDNGNSTAVSITGLTDLTSYIIDARAYDAAANASTTLSVTTSTYRAGASAGSIVTATGPTGGNPAGFLYALAGTLPTSDWVSYYIVSGPTPSGGTLDAQVNGAFSYFGPEPATLVIQPEINGVEDDQITVTLYDQSPDTTAPAFTGSITVAARTTTTITLTLPTAMDDTAVDGYEYRVDGGAWVDNGASTTVALTGLTELTSYTIDARAYDAVPNYSTTLSVTTSTFGTSSSPSGKKTPNGMISFWNR